MARLARLFAAGALALSTLAVIVPSPAAASDAAGHTFVAANMRPGPFTLAEALAVASHHDLVLANAQQFRGHVAAMKAANPRLELLVYLNGMFAQEAQATAFPDAWYARDAAGNKVTSRGYGNYLMDGRQPGWLDDRGRFCASQIEASGYDGCFVDMLGIAPLDPGYLSAPAIDPRTGAPWTTADWLDMTGAVGAAIKQAAGDRPVAVNGLGNGNRYFESGAPTSSLFDVADLALAEAWLRSGGAPVDFVKPEAAWKRDIDLLVDAERRGSRALVMTKLLVDATDAQQAAWHRFALASFLLGAGPSSRLSFVPSAAEAAPVHEWDTIDVGEPLGPYGRVGGAYVREFSNGTAVVNPTGSTVTISLSRSQTTLAGKSVTSLTLAPYSGEVLRHSGGSTGDGDDDSGEPAPTPTPVDRSSISRLSGPDRVATAIATSTSGVSAASVDEVVLARSDDFADALAATPLAVRGERPLLVTPRDRLDSRVAAELRRIARPGAVVHLLGGTAALGPAVESGITGLGLRIRRHAGANRYQTAVAVARFQPRPSLIVLTTGADFPDALTGGAVAGARDGVVLLTDGARVPQVVTTYLAEHRGIRVVAVGGPASRAVAGVQSIAGTDRYDTAKRVADAFFATPAAVGIARGDTFADALAGGAHAAGRGAPLLLAAGSLPTATAGYLSAHPTVARAYLYGGTSALNDGVADRVAGLLEVLAQ